MSADLPEPMTPPNCDLSDFKRMMIDIPRLRQSEFDADPSDAVWRAGFNLWLSAWHAVPAASLDNSEAALAKAAGLGRDLRTWRKVHAGALRGWIMCSDGRLYHATVAELALESWITKLLRRRRGIIGNKKRWGSDTALAQLLAPVHADLQEAKRLLERLNPDSDHIAKATPKSSDGDPYATDDDPLNVSHKDAPPSHKESHKDRTEDRKGQGQGQGQKKEKNISGANAPSPAGAGGEGMLPLELSPSTRDDGFAALWLIWPQKGRSSKREAQKDWAALLKRHTPAVLKAAVEAYLRSDDATRDLARTVPALERWLKKRAEAWVEIAANPNMEQANGRAHDGRANAGRTGSRRGDVVRAALRIKADDERRRQTSGDSDQGESGIPSGAAARLAPPGSSE